MRCEIYQDLLPKHNRIYPLKFNIYMDLYFQAGHEANVSITFSD